MDKQKQINAVVLTREEYGNLVTRPNLNTAIDVFETRKETAEKFAKKTNQAINAHRKKVGEDEYVVDARRLIFEVNEICKEIIGVPTTAELLEKGKKGNEVRLAKDIVGGKV